MSSDSVSMFQGAQGAQTANYLQLGASAIGAIGGAFGGQQKATATTYNANLATYDAAIVDQNAQAEAVQTQQQANRIIGAGIANAGASGIDPNQGSPVSIAADSAAQGSVASRMAIYRGLLQSGALRRQAAIDSWTANQQSLAGVASGGSTFLSGALKYLQNSPKTPSTPQMVTLAAGDNSLWGGS